MPGGVYRSFFHTWSHVFTREATPAQYRDLLLLSDEIDKGSTVGVDAGGFSAAICARLPDGRGSIARLGSAIVF